MNLCFTKQLQLSSSSKSPYKFNSALELRLLGKHEADKNLSLLYLRGKLCQNLSSSDKFYEL